MAGGKDLRAFRRERGLTLEAVALLGGIDKATVSRVENGITQARPETVVRLARALGVSAGRMHRLVAECSTQPGEPDGHG